MKEGSSGKPGAGACLAALGVVFGDIGTSPLYAFKAAVGASGSPSPAAALGCASLILWALAVTVSLKYVTLVMRADNRGEGGIVALAALALPGLRAGRARSAALWAGMAGAALLCADGAITPAISVLSAVEGLKEAAPWTAGWVTPASLAVLAALFLVQRRGTAAIGAWFGPVMLAWFAAIGAAGAAAVAARPGVLAAADPRIGLEFLAGNPGTAAAIAGAIFLCVTGGEALYADMGHFGRRAVTASWYAVALPSLALNYLGQAALVASDPAAAGNPFYGLVPGWLLLPAILLATAATVIASQAVISGVFSMARQAAALGWWPRLAVVQTSRAGYGQVYVASANWALAAGTGALVVAFGSSDALAAAYGLAVSGTMLATTLLVWATATRTWRWPAAAAAAACGPLAALDALFAAANAAKFADGGWVPAAVAAAVCAAAATWRSGQAALDAALRREAEAASARPETACGFKPAKARGAAVFLTRSGRGVPPVLARHARAAGSVHETVVLLSFETADAPHVAARDRLALGDTDGEEGFLSPAAWGDGHAFYRVRARYGFMQQPHAVLAMRESAALGLPVDARRATFFVGHESAVPSPSAGWASRTRTRLFETMRRLQADPSSHFGLPPAQVAEVGYRVEI
jgi:KUP system potassium uptake protein